jgi:hypothetical protein
MVIGPAKAGPICLSAGIELDGAPKVLHGAAAEHAVAGSTELFPQRGRDLFPSEHVLPGLDVFVARSEEVGSPRIVQVQVPTAAHQAGGFRDERHDAKVRVRKRQENAVFPADVQRGASLYVRP